MIQELRLEGFKNFRNAKLPLGNLSVIVGANASGKSNLRDAFRFLHGIARGYALSEIIGQKWIEGGAIQWQGIRGGTRELGFCGKSEFSLEVRLTPNPPDGCFTYKITVGLGENGAGPRVLYETVRTPYNGPHGLVSLFESVPQNGNARSGSDTIEARVWLPIDAEDAVPVRQMSFLSSRPILSQILATPVDPSQGIFLGAIVSVLKSMRFFEFDPDAMRIPSIPGQDVLGDRGENLSSVLQAICARETSKKAVLEWIRELTPSDVVAMEFVPDQTGKVLLSLVESSGQRTSAYSASDGTLRFLAMIAAMMGSKASGGLRGTKPASFYFIEELENGIHPTRLQLLLQLIEQKAGEGHVQVVATTHSPQLLSLLSEESRRNAALVYRLADQPDARITPILKIPEAERVLKQQDWARLHSSGWLEDAVAFMEGAAT